MSEVQSLKDEIRLLKEKQLVLEDQISFYKYKYKLIKISSLNGRLQDDKLITIHVLFLGQTHLFKVPCNYKIISLKRLISDKLNIQIAFLTLCISENELANEYTLDDYLIKEEDTIILKPPPRSIVIDGKNHVCSNETTVADLKRSLQIDNYLTQDGIVVSDDAELYRLGKTPNFKTKRFKVSMTDGDSKVGVYGIDNVSELKSLDVCPAIPKDIDLLLTKENTSISLQVLRWEIKLNDWSSTVRVKDLNCTDLDVKKMLKVPEGFDIQVYANFAFRWYFSHPLNFLDPFSNHITTFRLVKRIRIPPYDVYSGMSLTHFSGLNCSDLKEQLKGYFLTSKETGKVVEKPSWRELNGKKLTTACLEIHDFTNEIVCRVGIDLKDKCKTFAEILDRLDDFTYDQNWDIFYLSGITKPTFIQDAKGTTLEMVISLEAAKFSLVFPLHVHRRLKISRISNPGVSLSYGYNESTTILMLKDFIKSSISNFQQIEGFRLLYCKKSSTREGFVNLQRFYNYELLVNCNLTRENNLIYYEVEDTDPHSKTREMSVIEYSKLQKLGMINGIIKKYKVNISDAQTIIHLTSSPK